MNTQCCYQVNKTPGLRFPRFGDCSFKAVVERDGKSYCKVHDPVERDKRNRAKQAKLDNQLNSERRRWECLSACHGMTDPEKEIKRLQTAESVLRIIISDLPSNRDWLNPDLEKSAKEVLGIKPQKPKLQLGDRGQELGHCCGAGCIGCEVWCQERKQVKGGKTV